MVSVSVVFGVSFVGRTDGHVQDGPTNGQRGAPGGGEGSGVLKIIADCCRGCLRAHTCRRRHKKKDGTKSSRSHTAISQLGLMDDDSSG